MKHAPRNGFTLTEVMIVLLILSIVLAIGVPSFLGLIEKTRTRTATEDLVELLRLARLTAVEQATRVSVCASTDGATCSGSKDDWNKRIIAVHNPESGTPETLINLEVGNGVTLTHNKHDANEQGEGGYTIDFTANGWTPGDQASLFVCSDEGTSDSAYRIYIAISGKIRVEQYEEGVDWSCSADA